jgi:hypothetical protein
MALRNPKPSFEDEAAFGEAWLAQDEARCLPTDDSGQDSSEQTCRVLKPSQRNILQGLLTFASLQDEFHRRALPPQTEINPGLPAVRIGIQQPFVLDEVLQSVADRALVVTGADGVAIALAENGDLVLRAGAGTVRPEMGARIDRDSMLSWACFSTARVVTCSDTEADARVDLKMCRRLGARSVIAAPVQSKQGVIGLIEAFSARPNGFVRCDVDNLNLLAEMLLVGMDGQDENRFAESAQIAATKLGQFPRLAAKPIPVTLKQSDRFEEAPPAVADVEAPGKTELILIPFKRRHERELESNQVSVFEVDSAIENNALHVPPGASESGGHWHRFLFLLVFLVVVAALAEVLWNPKPMQPKKALAAAPASEPSFLSSAKAAGNRTDATNTAPDSATVANGVMSVPAVPNKLPTFPRIIGIQHSSAADSSTVIFELDDSVKYEAHRLTSPERIYLDLRDTQPANNIAESPINVDDALLRRVRIGHAATGTRIVLETKIRTDFSVSLKSNPYRLVVELGKIEANAGSR